MSSLLQLNQKLEAIRVHLQAGRLIEAAATVQEAVALCKPGEDPVDRSQLEAAVLLEQQCALVAQHVVDALVKTQRESGAMEKAIRAYAGG